MKLLQLALGATLCLAPLSAVHAAGAIAVNDEEGRSAADVGYGYATDRESRDEAGRAAVRACREHGNASCKVVVRFDTCGAYATSREHSGIGYGSSERVARSKAMEDCGGDRCRIVTAVCDRH